MTFKGSLLPLKNMNMLKNGVATLAFIDEDAWNTVELALDTHLLYAVCIHIQIIFIESALLLRKVLWAALARMPSR